MRAPGEHCVLVERTRYELRIALPPDRVIAALIDFGPNRVHIWRETSHPVVYRVHWRGDHRAEVTEGVPFAWSRERYDWSAPGVVTLTQVASNVARNGTIRYEVHADSDGSRIVCDRYREFFGLRGGLAGTLMVIAGRAILRRQLAVGLQRV